MSLVAPQNSRETRRLSAARPKALHAPERTACDGSISSTSICREREQDVATLSKARGVSTITASSYSLAKRRKAASFRSFEAFGGAVVDQRDAGTVCASPVAGSVVFTAPPEMWRCSGGTGFICGHNQSFRMTTTWQCKEQIRSYVWPRTTTFLSILETLGQSCETAVCKMCRLHPRA